ncbi:MAG: hypothetical protein ACJ8GJ_09125 [Vitreoscilla sp.]
MQLPATIMNSSTKTERTRDDLDDGRNGRVVGENDDNALESIGKAIVAPVEGADERAGPAAQPDRAFTDLTQTLPQGQEEVRAPQSSTPRGDAP